MSSNNLYDQLMEMARMENIEFSETQSSRATDVVSDNQFAKAMKKIRSEIEQVRINNELILGLKKKMAMNAIPAQETDLFDKTRILCDQNYDVIKAIKEHLEAVSDIVAKAKTESPDEPETHSQIYQKQYLTQEVNSIISDTHKIQKLVEQFSINTSLKRIKALAPELDDEEAENLARKKDGFDQLIMQKTLGKASLKLKYRIDDIIEKNKGIVRLEQSVQQNLRLMEEIAFLVKQQGEMIDNIATNILQAKDYVEKAEVILKNEKKKHKKSRKKMCCIILICLIILALIVVPIVLTVVNKNKANNNK